MYVNVPIHCGTRGLLVLLERIARDQKQRRACVDDAGIAREEGRAVLAVGDILVNTPVHRRRGRGRDRRVRDVASVPVHTDEYMRAYDVMSALT